MIFRIVFVIFISDLTKKNQKPKHWLTAVSKMITIYRRLFEISYYYDRTSFSVINK